MALLAQFNMQTTCFLQERHHQLPGGKKPKPNHNKTQQPLKTPQISRLWGLPTSSFESSELSLNFSTQKAANARNLTRSALAEVSCRRRDAGHGHMLYHRQMQTPLSTVPAMETETSFTTGFIGRIQELLKTAHLYLEHHCCQHLLQISAHIVF